MTASNGIRGKTALITGAAKRIGAHIAETLAAEGVNIILHYRSSSREASEIETKLKVYPVKTYLARADFDNPDNYRDFIENTWNMSGGFDFLINNASVFPPGNLEDMTLEDLEHNIRINAWAPFQLSRDFAEKAEKGVIINLIDTRVDELRTDWYVAYNLSKLLLHRLTRLTALEFAPAIRVNGISPGLILPPEGKDQKYLEKLKNSVPLKMTGKPEYISQAVLFLLECEFITGEILHVDGGNHLRGTSCG